MNRMTELDFVHQLYLRNKRKHSKGYNYSCDICGDKKKRGYLLINNDCINLYCHNCGSSLLLRKYIELYDPIMFEQYREVEKKEYIENLRQGKTLTKKQVYKSPVINSGIENLKLFKLNKKYFIPATENKECVEYCKQRKIPDEIIETLKYCTHTKLPCGDMLIFPCYWKDNEHIYAFQGRSIKEKRFYIHSKNDSFKVNGIFQVDLNKPVFIFESWIDSFSKTNSIAAMGADISVQVLSMIKEQVFCFDNDKTGLDKALKYATAGYKVFIWPSEIKAKDCNELVTKWNWTNDKIETMINNNIFYGLSAISRLQLRLKNRKK